MTEQTETGLTDYQRGYIDGLRAYAWWKYGVQYVGTCGCTLKAAMEMFLTADASPGDLHEPDLLQELGGIDDLLECGGTVTIEPQTVKAARIHAVLEKVQC